MKTTIHEQDERIVAVLEGELDTAAAQDVENALKPLFVDDKRDILLDCAQLDYIASSGLRILVSLLKNAKANGRKVTLKDVNDDIKNVFKLTGFLTLFDFE
ncbi:MAG: STAS domain-containing protein [Bacteroidaceae bacterium]|jgi:anti-anti-sigma factor|nr:STAS domain-containing protein [Bacteroidaceae bacterium]MBR3548118.1 STAS domain-containing protein [Bacteroidaceae bacterium]MBR6047858.1 STAS domain-containing protein [Bacteroidaceae bacterium]